MTRGGARPGSGPKPKPDPRRHEARARLTDAESLNLSWFKRVRGLARDCDAVRVLINEGCDREADRLPRESRPKKDG